MYVPILPDEMPNITVVERGDPMYLGDHNVVSTEIVEMELTGEAGISVSLNDEAPPSAGQIVGPDSGLDFPADSFFDVYVEIEIPEIPGLVLWNAQPIPLQSLGITGIPPLGSTYDTPASWSGAMLFDQRGQPSGFAISRVVHILPPARPEWEVIECDCMEYKPDYTFVVQDACSECADLNCDGIVNFKDLAKFAQQWLSSCP